MNVYLASSGSYSDYRVNAVFDSKALAQQYVDRENDIDPYYEGFIEECELFSELPKIISTTRVTASLFPDGSLSEMQVSTTSGTEDERPTVDQYPNPNGGYSWPITIRVQNYRSEGEARKALQDRAAQIRAQIAGIA